MVDIVNASTRSRMMSGIRSSDTKPEMLIRKGLFSRGYRYRLNVKRLPGTPDLVLAKYNAIIFVHGCFWHGHGCHLFKWPSSRSTFWKAKISRNIEKDSEVMAELRKLGWRVFVIWECTLKGKGKRPLSEVIDRTSNWIIKGAEKAQIRGLNC